MRVKAVQVGVAVLAAGVALVGAGVLASSQSDSAGAHAQAHRRALALSLRFPIRAAFYQDWSPMGWRRVRSGAMPSLGHYRSTSRRVILTQANALRYAHVGAAIASWDGPHSASDATFERLLQVTTSAHRSLRWAAEYDGESSGDPSATRIRSDLRYLHRVAVSSAAYLRVDGRFVVFVRAGASDGCGRAQQWKSASRGLGAFVVFEAFSGYSACREDAASWYPYAPSAAESSVPAEAFAISPGYLKPGGGGLARSLSTWAANVRDMIASNADWQLISTFNGWATGNAVESAPQWSSRSGYGRFLDILHHNGRAGSRPVAQAQPAGADPVIAAAGDIACDPHDPSFDSGNGSAEGCQQKATAALILAMHPAAVLTLGDTQYEVNDYNAYLQSFDPAWGALKPLIRPAIGNHEYLTANASGYFQYFGAAAAPPNAYYSYDIGPWHLIALNSECSHVGGCDSGSPQERWLLADLVAHHNRCTLAYWHEPRFSNGEHGDATQMTQIWADLYQAGVDIVLSGHNHDYERYDPLGPTGAPDPNGIREFVVGTGGKNHYPITSPPLPGEAISNSTTFGALRIVLHPTSYDWQFIPIRGQTFTDSGTATCH